MRTLWDRILLGSVSRSVARRATAGMLRALRAAQHHDDKDKIDGMRKDSIPALAVSSAKRSSAGSVAAVVAASKECRASEAHQAADPSVASAVRASSKGADGGPPRPGPDQDSGAQRAATPDSWTSAAAESGSEAPAAAGRASDWKHRVLCVFAALKKRDFDSMHEMAILLDYDAYDSMKAVLAGMDAIGGDS